MKTFEDWFTELEGYSLRAERFYDEMDTHTDGMTAIAMVKWLRAAYEAGKDHAQEAYIDDGK
jgi:hypothetical protein